MPENGYITVDCRTEPAAAEERLHHMADLIKARRRALNAERALGVTVPIPAFRPVRLVLENWEEMLQLATQGVVLSLAQGIARSGRTVECGLVLRTARQDTTPRGEIPLWLIGSDVLRSFVEAAEGSAHAPIAFERRTDEESA